MNMGSRYSYFFKIQFLLIVFAILPSLVVSLISFTVVKDIITDKIKNNNQQLIEVIGGDLKRTIDDIAYATNYFVRDSHITQSLVHLKDKEKVSSYQDYAAVVNVENFIALSLMKSEHLKSQMFIITPANLLLAKDSQIVAQISKKLDLFKTENDQIKPTQIYWLDSRQISEQLNLEEPFHYAARKIVHPITGDFLGTLFIGLPNSYFTQLFAQAKQGDLYLSDSQGHVIARNGYQPTPKSNETFIKNTLSIPKADWHVSYETPQSEITGEISKVLYYSIVLIAISLTIFLSLSVFLALRVHRPIHKLQRIVRKFSTGQRSIRVDVKGNDEIAMFGKVFNSMLDEINQLIEDMEQEQREKRALELQTLFAQIRPHFLINTLYAIRCNLLLEGDQYHSKHIQSLMNLLRGYMKTNEQSTLAYECKLLQDYVHIMQIKNNLEVKLIIDLPESLGEFKVPRLLLQPIVENALIHGFAEPPPDPLIHIRVQAAVNRLQIEISDNGSGLHDEEIFHLLMRLSELDHTCVDNGEHLGLANTERRLKLTYGNQSGITIKRNDEQGVTCGLLIPITKTELNEFV